MSCPILFSALLLCSIAHGLGLIALAGYLYSQSEAPEYIVDFALHIKGDPDNVCCTKYFSSTTEPLSFV